ncbi:hypothetical protein ACFZAU_14435 [Streptomyces sp. NPDC008238]
MRQKLVKRIRAWTTQRKITVYLIAQAILLILIITAVRTWDVDVPALAYLAPWLSTATGGLIGIILGTKKSSP